jgi:HD-GYP domain-containing protein (c-di-GMP phosphodiesterase class II)
MADIRAKDHLEAAEILAERKCKHYDQAAALALIDIAKSLRMLVERTAAMPPPGSPM